MKSTLLSRAKQPTLYFLNLENINLQGVDLRDVGVLSWINLNGANLAKAQLNNMNYLCLQKTNLSEARFVPCESQHGLSYCIAEGANLKSSIGTNLYWSYSSFNHADFTYADLTAKYFAVLLNDANLTRARIVNISNRPGGHSSMQNAILHGTYLDNILLTDSSLTQGVSLFTFNDFSAMKH